MCTMGYLYTHVVGIDFAIARLFSLDEILDQARAEHWHVVFKVVLFVILLSFFTV